MKLLQNKTNVDAPTTAYPFGNSKDDTGSNNGTPVDRERFNDWDQLFEKVFNESGLTANGNDDNETNGFQLFNAFRKMFRPYRVYTGLISQTGTNDPTITILGLNDVGTIVWTRNAVGQYNGTLVGSFEADKTYYEITTGLSNGIEAFLRRVDDDNLILDTRIGGSALDGALSNTPIEIRVYDESLV